eukprot:715889-Pelagomonas_calceolata.AAC.4
MDHVPWLQGTGQQGPAGLSDESSTPSEQQLEDMRVELHAVGAEASSAQGIGHDIYDPFEATGVYVCVCVCVCEREREKEVDS